jgi:uncharacterized secreted protein with C-terminal beta-propeller domain
MNPAPQINQPPNNNENVVSVTADTSARAKSKLIKSLRNKKDYLQRKTIQLQSSHDEIKDKLVIAHDHIADLEHTNSLAILEAQQLKADAAKSNDLLSLRTQRFDQFRSRKQEELKRTKATAASRIETLQEKHVQELQCAEVAKMALESSHKKELKRAHSEIYNLERKHNKLIVACNGKIDRIKKKKSIVLPYKFKRATRN